MNLLNTIDLYYNRPDCFAEDICGFIPDDWQRDIMLAINENPRVSVRSGQGVGKTGVESILLIWYLCTRPFPRVVATAPTQQQLYDVLWAETNKWLRTSKVKNLLKWTKTKVYMRGYEGVWYATARTAAKPENMQGFHEDHMLFIVDEGSGVNDDIFEAIMGTLSGKENKIAVFGNPTKTTGFFYDIHNINRDLWHTKRVSSRNSKRTSKENIAALEKKYGRESDVVRVRVDGEFPQNQSESLISLVSVERAMESTVDISSGKILYIGADIARFGDDKTIIAPRISGKVFELKKYRKKDTMETAGNVIKTAKEYKLLYPQVNKVVINVDDDGLGAGVTDRLREINREQGLNYSINACHNGGIPRERDRYENWISEAWDGMGLRLNENLSCYVQGISDSVELPKDEELASQLVARRYFVNSKGKIELEKKDQMKKRIGVSPDCADAVLLSFNSISTTKVIGGRVY